MYSYLIVGSGIYGSVFAYEKTKQGKKCLVIDKRSHIGGNCYTEKIAGINCGLFGPHILNSNNSHIWKYIQNFCEMEQYSHRVKVNYQDKIYSFPINLLTLQQIGVSPDEINFSGRGDNLEEWAVSTMGQKLFETFFKGYSEKQWGRPCSQIPAGIGRRIPIRLNYDDRYHQAKYSGIPRGGDYTEIFDRLLEDVEYSLNTDFADIKNWRSIAKQLVYTGPIDEFFDYKYGPLDYRSLRFETTVLDREDFQGCSQMNYTDVSVPFTRIVEHKWFSPTISKKTVITHEFPQDWSVGKERFYPVANAESQALYGRYKAEIPFDVLVSGRLGRFKYIDMDAAVALALTESKNF